MTMMIKKRHGPSATKPVLPTQQNDDDSKGDGHPEQKQKSADGLCTTRTPKKLYHALLIVTLGILGMLGIINPIDILEITYDALIKPSDRTLYGPPSNITSKFVSAFEEMLTTDKGVTIGHGHFVPLLLENGRLLCRRRHKHKMSWLRARKFAKMIRMGLAQQQSNSPISYGSINYGIDEGLPILLTEGDGLYCDVVTKKDDSPFPRLAWSIVAPTKHGNWCQAIGIPSYETWHWYHRKYKHPSDWIAKFNQNEKQYPWSKKIDKAVWRGSTTYEISQYGKSHLNETPRGQLVKNSVDHPELIDAGFIKINQKFANERKKLKKVTNVARGMSMSDMMKYKAIIDIDGNNWSSRFGMLLCMNSVVIKIDPDFIEYFYKGLQPMVHYIPATLQNITEAVQYAIDKNNEKEMQSMIKEANSWCQKTLIEPAFIDDAMIQLGEYSKALKEMKNESWREEWKGVKKRFIESIGDFVDCDARNVVSYFID